MKRFETLCAMLCLALLLPRAHASEGSVYGGPVGGTDIRNAYLPAAAGFYLGTAYAAGSANRYNGDDGKKSSTIGDASFNYDIIAAYGLYVYPFKLGGGTLASGLQLAYSPQAEISINGDDQYFPGLLDPYVDIVKWSRYLGSASGGLPYGLTVQAAYSMILPYGDYDSNKLTSTGHNTTFVIPNIAATYLTGRSWLGDGVELSARVFYDYSFKNSKTDYHSGSVIDVDTATTVRTGALQYGVAAFAAYQVENDVRSGQIVAPDGKRLRIIKAGPVASYTFSNQVSVKFKLTLPISMHNTLVGPTYLFTASLPL